MKAFVPHRLKQNAIEPPESQTLLSGTPSLIAAVGTVPVSAIGGKTGDIDPNNVFNNPDPANDMVVSSAFYFQADG